MRLICLYLTALSGADGALISKAIMTSNVSVGSAYSRLTDTFRIADVVQKKPQQLLLGWEKQKRRGNKNAEVHKECSAVGARPPGLTPVMCGWMRYADMRRGKERDLVWEKSPNTGYM